MNEFIMVTDHSDGTQALVRVDDVKRVSEHSESGETFTTLYLNDGYVRIRETLAQVCAALQQPVGRPWLAYQWPQLPSTPNGMYSGHY